MAKQTLEEKLELKNKVGAIDRQYKILYNVAVHSAKVLGKTYMRLYKEFMSAGFTAEQSLELVKVTQLRAGLEEDL